MKGILIKRIWFAVFLSILSCSSYAAEWRQIFKNPNTEIYVDQSTLKAADNEKIITVKNNAIQGDKSPSSLELKYLINCSSKTFALVSATQFRAIDLQGEGVALKVTTPPVVTNPNPGSVGELYVKVACETIKPPVASASPPAQQPMAVSQQAVAGNFLIGLCVSSPPHSDPLVTSCKVEDLRMRPVWMTGVRIYGASSMKSLLIFGAKSDPAYRKDNNTDVPVAYEIRGPNEVIVTSNAYGGCTFVEKITKNGNDIFEEHLQIKGSCNDAQQRAFQEQKKEGKKKLAYTRAI